MKTKVVTMRTVLVLLTLHFFGGISGAQAQEKKVSIVATTGMITDVVSRIVGDRFPVTGLIRSGVDPHLYKPTRSDILTLKRASIIFYNGLLLEGKMTDALIRVASSGTRVHPVTELIEESYLLEPPEFEGSYDPHVWMDPIAWTKAARVIATKLSEFDPTGAPVYEANLREYEEELQALDRYAVKALSSIPAPQRELVTAHDAFNYFGKRYNVNVRGIQGISTESEAGVRDIETLVRFLVQNNIPAVFVESTVSDRNVKALIEGAAAQGHRVKIGGSLYSDAMGAPGTYEGTYVGMIDHNITTIARALGGTAPTRGLNGKLSSK